MAVVEGNSHIISAALKGGEEGDPIAEEWVIEEEEALAGRRMQQLRQEECDCIEKKEVGTSQSSDRS